jgi:hypothetical protein
MPSLIHCIYASAATRRLENEDLASLLEEARASNERMGLTGMLLHVEGSFLQVLEGQASVVDPLYARIARDPRHEQVTLVIHEPIAKRAFQGWTMGYESMTHQELAELAGVNDFFGERRCLAEVRAGRARKLLGVFAEGRWRSKAIGAQPEKLS